MVAVFWTNTIWYIALGLTTLAEVAYALFRAEDRRRAVAFYITLTGMTLWLETFLLIFFKAYAYYPHIVTDPAHAYDDILAGNLFSQFSVGASMLMVAVLRLKPRWYVALALAYGGIEALFVALGVYQHGWYQTWYTVALLPFVFWLARKMYDRLREGLRPLFYYAYVSFSLFALVTITLWWGLELADIQAGTDTLLANNAEAGKYGLAVAAHLVISTVLLAAYFGGIPWRWKALVMTALFMSYAGVYRAGLLIIRDGWLLPVSAAVILTTYAAIALEDRLYGLSDGTLMRRRVISAC
jgi:hypothetical protein